MSAQGSQSSVKAPAAGDSSNSARIVHATSLKNAVKMTQVKPGYVVFDPSPYKPHTESAAEKDVPNDVKCGSLVWFGLPDSMTDEAKKAFSTRYGSVQFEIKAASFPYEVKRKSGFVRPYTRESSNTVILRRTSEQSQNCISLSDILAQSDTQRFVKQSSFNQYIGKQRLAHPEIVILTDNPIEVPVEDVDIVAVSHRDGPSPYQCIREYCLRLAQAKAQKPQLQSAKDQEREERPREETLEGAEVEDEQEETKGKEPCADCHCEPQERADLFRQLCENVSGKSVKMESQCGTRDCKEACFCSQCGVIVCCRPECCPKPKRECDTCDPFLPDD